MGRKSDEVWRQSTPKKFKGKHADWYWATVNIPLTKKEVTKLFGKPCKREVNSCPCCMAWRQWRKTGRATLTIERNLLVKL